jgi:hypothetical protein
MFNREKQEHIYIVKKAVLKAVKQIPVGKMELFRTQFLAPCSGHALTTVPKSFFL